MVLKLGIFFPSLGAHSAQNLSSNVCQAIGVAEYEKLDKFGLHYLLSLRIPLLSQSKMNAFRLSLSLFILITNALAATVRVSSISELVSSIAAAVPGTTIVVQNGIYISNSSININRAGSADKPIFIMAETIGGVEIQGTSGFSFENGAAFVTIQGFNFTHSTTISMGEGARNCRLTRNVIQLAIPKTSPTSYITVIGNNMEIDHNELRNKSTLGQMINVSGVGTQVAQQLWIHHNYFHDFKSPGGNGAETIRLGLSGLSTSNGSAIVEYNLFLRCRGENEIISNKSGGNTFRYNTFLDSQDAQLSFRHGNDSLAYGNYFQNTNGLRVYGHRHQIFSNYFFNNSLGIDMGNGDGDVGAGAPLVSHDRPVGCFVVFNTFINNDVHYSMGGRKNGLGATNITVANNIYQGPGNMASVSSTAPYSGVFFGNIRFDNNNAGIMSNDAFKTVDPMLKAGNDGIFHIQEGSPAIGSVVGSFPFVTVDMDGQPRNPAKDVGADELSTHPILAKFLTPMDVGI